MGRAACIRLALGLFLGVVCTSTADAQTLPPPIITAAHAVLPPVPQLRLSWPIQPLELSFSAGPELTGYATGPLLLYRAEALWLRAPGLQLLTAQGAERAYELDCRLTCQPVARNVFELEARLALPASVPGTQNDYAFVRSTSFGGTPGSRRGGLLSAGFAGVLDF